MKQEREAAWEEGHRAGIEEGHRAGIEEGHRAGIEEGHREGLNSGIMLTKQVLQLSAGGKSIEDIARECSISPEQVKRILE